MISLTSNGLKVRLVLGVVDMRKNFIGGGLLQMESYRRIVYNSRCGLP